MSAPVWVRALAGASVVAVGWLGIWLQSFDPILGFPVTSPMGIVFLIVFVVAGIGLATWDRGWEKPPPGSSSEDETQWPADKSH